MASLARCAHPGCNRFAVVPPKGYALNLPACFAHIERYDSILYTKEINELWESELRNEAKCAFCGFCPWEQNAAKLPCCGAYICCGPSACEASKDIVLCHKCGGSITMDVELDKSLQNFPVRWFAPWEYVEEVARTSVSTNHQDQLDIYEVCYLKVVEKGLDLVKEVELIKANFELVKIGTDDELFREEVRRVKDKFDALYSFYQELLVKLGVNPKITPAFVPTAVYEAFSYFSSEGH